MTDEPDPIRGWDSRSALAARHRPLLPTRDNHGATHCLVADGVFEEAVGDAADAQRERPAPVFLAVPEPTDDDLARVLRAVANDRRVAERIDLGEQDADPRISACVQLGLATVSPQSASPRRAAKLNVPAFGMNVPGARRHQ